MPSPVLLFYCLQCTVIENNVRLSALCTYVENSLEARTDSANSFVNIITADKPHSLLSSHRDRQLPQMLSCRHTVRRKQCPDCWRCLCRRSFWKPTAVLKRAKAIFPSFVSSRDLRCHYANVYTYYTHVWCTYRSYHSIVTVSVPCTHPHCTLNVCATFSTFDKRAACFSHHRLRWTCLRREASSLPGQINVWPHWFAVRLLFCNLCHMDPLTLPGYICSDQNNRAKHFCGHDESERETLSSMRERERNGVMRFSLVEVIRVSHTPRFGSFTSSISDPRIQRFKHFEFGCNDWNQRKFHLTLAAHGNIDLPTLLLNIQKYIRFQSIFAEIYELEEPLCKLMAWETFSTAVPWLVFSSVYEFIPSKAFFWAFYLTWPCRPVDILCLLLLFLGSLQSSPPLLTLPQQVTQHGQLSHVARGTSRTRPAQFRDWNIKDIVMRTEGEKKFDKYNNFLLHVSGNSF